MPSLLPSTGYLVDKVCRWSHTCARITQQAATTGAAQCSVGSFIMQLGHETLS